MSSTEARTTYRNRLKQRAKDAKRTNSDAASPSPIESTEPPHFSIPTVTEDDLLAFQLSHFGDDTKPDAWFVDAETALSYQPEFDQDLGEEEDDGLGYYEDGVERTLTDEQIEMFRHTEMEQLIREGLISRDERESEQNEVVERAKHTSEDMDTESLLSVETPTKHNDRRNSSASRRSSSTTKGRQRAKDIPYDERNKRNWETYIEDEDPRHGSRTHRRIVRELDEQQVQDVELDY